MTRKRNSCRPQVAIAALLVAVLALASQRPALAEQQLSLAVSSQLVSDSGLFAVGASNHMTQADLGYAHSLRTLRRGELWLEVGSTAGTRSGTPFASLESSALFATLAVGVRYTLPVYSWLVPQLRVGAGALLGKLSMSDGTTRAQQWSAAFTSYLLGGVQLLIPRSWMQLSDASTFSAGLVIEGGWVQASPLSYSLTPDDTSGVRQIPVQGTNVGSLDLSGPVLHVGATMRF